MSDISRRESLKLGLSALAAAPLVVASANTAAAATHTVEIESFKFMPATLNVAVGDTVVFTNSDGAPHTGTADDGSFDTGRLNQGQSGEVTISAAGSHGYKCKFHPNMTGVIVAS